VVRNLVLVIFLSVPECARCYYDNV